MIGYIVLGVVAVLAVVIAARLGRRAGRRSLQQRLTALSNRLGVEPPDDGGVEPVLSHLEKVTGEAAEAVTEASSDAIRLRRALDTLPQGVIVCDENGEIAFRNARAMALMNNRHGDALAAQAVTELLENAWHDGSAERTLDLYGPPRQTLTVRTRLIDDGRRPLGVIAIIEDVSERRRLEEIRRDFVANVSHELKTPIGALGLLAETLTVEPDPEVGPAAGLAHPHRGLPGQPDHRRPARPQPHRVRGGPAPRAHLRQPGDGRGGRAGPVGGRAATDHHRAAMSPTPRSTSSATAASWSRPSTASSRTP